MRFALYFAALAAAPLIACMPHSVTIAGGEPPVVHEGSGHGPPPHAPAHGYRRKHEQAYHSHTGSVELVFDSGLGVYVVVGMRDYYYWNNSYLYVRDGQWWMSTYLDGEWRPRDTSSLPGGLQQKYAAGAKGKKAKKNAPAKMRER